MLSTNNSVLNNPLHEQQKSARGCAKLSRDLTIFQIVTVNRNLGL